MSVANKSENFSDLNVPVSGLYLLARENTPPEVVEAVAERSGQGERLSLAEVKGLIADAEEKGRAKIEGEIARLTEKHDAEAMTARLKAEAPDLMELVEGTTAIITAARAARPGQAQGRPAGTPAGPFVERATAASVIMQSLPRQGWRPASPRVDS